MPEDVRLKTEQIVAKPGEFHKLKEVINGVNLQKIELDQKISQTFNQYLMQEKTILCIYKLITCNSPDCMKQRLHAKHQKLTGWKWILDKSNL
jgi:hypothetical protein